VTGLRTSEAIQQTTQIMTEEDGDKIGAQVEVIASMCDTDGRVRSVNWREKGGWCNCKSGRDLDAGGNQQSGWQR
jgi:hypothetical protein